MVLHETQPMVVDVRVRLQRAGTVEAQLVGDSGARVGSLTGNQPALEHVVRLRGLAPATPFELQLAPVDERGFGDVTTIAFTTLPALPGFVPSFDVSTDGDPSDQVRIFDFSVLPSIDQAGLFALDPDGRTRFYLPRDTSYDGLEAVVAGTKLLDDGTLAFTQGFEFWHVTELGVVLSHLAPDALGVPGLHHDVLQLPNGNFMALSYEFADIYYPDDDVTRHVAGDLIVEFTPEGEVVWTWDAFDHLDPLRIRDGFFTEMFPIVDPATGEEANDWTHADGIVYDADDESVLLSLRHQDWLVKIDHETGDVLWRLGEEGDFVLDSGEWFYHQHSPEWQPDGSLLLYDNGIGNPNLDDELEHSRAARFELDTEAMVARQVWEHAAGYASAIAGDADRLENGNVLVLDSTVSTTPGELFPAFSRISEVVPGQGSAVWTLELAEWSFVTRSIAASRLPGEVANMD